MSRRIDILLSTYNGADYLNEQLASIAAQDIDEWRLMIRDDGSTDNSVAIIKKFALDHPGRVLIISGPSVRKGWLLHMTVCSLKVMHNMLPIGWELLMANPVFLPLSFAHRIRSNHVRYRWKFNASTDSYRHAYGG